MRAPGCDAQRYWRRRFSQPEEPQADDKNPTRSYLASTAKVAARQNPASFHRITPLKPEIGVVIGVPPTW
jgi:hypothetical protein